MTPELLEIAKPFFEAYPLENLMIITADGMVFLQENLNDAANHQARIAEGSSFTKVYRKQLNGEELEEVKDETPEFDYNSLSPEEKEAYDAVVAELNEEEKAQYDKDIANSAKQLLVITDPDQIPDSEDEVINESIPSVGKAKDKKKGK